ncbi:MAG: hypothetical protein NDI90_06575 [Nitrospira sp. BO4]|jgi:hypothetical protein|nr:hypothetical protein [Nitrospira sp. BO4]
MDKGPWNRETLQEKTSRRSTFFNPSFIPDYALQAMAESSERLIRPVRNANI